MIELPEIVTLTRQMKETLVGKAIDHVEVEESRPKFLFLTPEPPVFGEKLKGRRIADVTSGGKWIHARLDNDETLLIGEFGGRLLYHGADQDLPAKRHLTFRFGDGSAMTLAIQMWGFVGALSPQEIEEHPYASNLGPTPFGEAFTLGLLNETLDRYLESENKPIKAFLTHEANICGIGNGYLQDILFRARLSPKRKVDTLSTSDRKALHDALRETLEEAIDLGGRDTERTLFGKPGGYVPLLDKRAKDTDCIHCGTPIQKIQYLGGSCYLCPTCQT